MKKIALLLAVLIALSLFVACSAQEEQDKLPEGSQEITEQPTEQPKEEKYVMYMDSGSNFESEAVVLGNEVTIKAAAYKDFSRSKTTKIDRPENMPETYRFDLDGVTYNLRHYNSHTTELAKVEKFAEFGQYSEYISSSGKTKLHLSLDGQKILFFANPEIDAAANGSFTKEEAIEKAATILKQLYGENVLDDYEFEGAQFSEIGNISRVYHVGYRRYAHGMPTSDRFVVSFNLRGELYGIDARDAGTMAYAETDISEKSIEAAKAMVEAQYGQGQSKTLGYSLLLDAEGNYYLLTGVLHDDGVCQFKYRVYINVIDVE